MKLHVILLVAFVVGLTERLCAGTLYIEPMPSSLRLDTEVSTNIVFNSLRQDVEMLNVRLRFTGTLSNNVEIAFGCDADGDGVLAPEETRMMLGWRAGRYFIEDVAGANRILEEAVGTNDVQTLQLEVKADRACRPKTFACTSDEGERFAELAANIPFWTYDTRWNLVRVTRRGGNSTDEWCQILSHYQSFFISIRQLRYESGWLKEIFGQIVLWLCGLGMAAIFASWVVYALYQTPTHIKASESYATGRNPVPEWGVVVEGCVNVNMVSFKKPSVDQAWLHGFMKDCAFMLISDLFDDVEQKKGN